LCSKYIIRVKKFDSQNRTSCVLTVKFFNTSDFVVYILLYNINTLIPTMYTIYTNVMSKYRTIILFVVWSECVSVALGIYLAKRMYLLCCHQWRVWLFRIIPRYQVNGMI
jgi:hypothetical protein